MSHRTPVVWCCVYCLFLMAGEPSRAAEPLLSSPGHEEKEVNAAAAMESEGSAEGGEGEGVYELPQFITRDFINIDKISCVSLFRSSVGHDYSWASPEEECRSMKHYFRPREDVDGTTLIIFTPTSGIVVRMREEWIGTQVEIVPDAAPDFTIHIFHIFLDPSIVEGVHVRAGQPLGMHTGVTSAADIGVRGPADAYSYFQVMTPQLFQKYIDKGVQSVDDFMLTKEERDNDPLECDGDQFLTRGTLPQWYCFGQAEGEGAAEGGDEGPVEGEAEIAPEGEGDNEGVSPVFHSADENRNGRIDLVELLRVIQFFNVEAYHCAEAPENTEDGYLPGPGLKHDCAAHSGDYAPQDWRVSLSELLRVVQLHNSPAYHACPGEGTEDGFCIGD